MADKNGKDDSTIDKLLKKAKSALAESIDKGTPDAMKDKYRRAKMDSAIDEMVNGRQTTDSNN